MHWLRLEATDALERTFTGQQGSIALPQLLVHAVR